MDSPLRTLEEWEEGRRQMSDYLLSPIIYHVGMQKLVKGKGIEVEIDVHILPISQLPADESGLMSIRRQPFFGWQ